MKKALISLVAASGFALLIWGAASAADSYLIKIKTDTQTSVKMKLVDLGDGTFAMATSDAAAPSPSGTYALKSKEATSAPDSLSGTGAGLGWAVIVFGGEATITVNGGDATKIRAGRSLEGDFKGLSTNPTISLTALDAGATAQLLLEMSE